MKHFYYKTCLLLTFLLFASVSVFGQKAISYPSGWDSEKGCYVHNGIGYRGGTAFIVDENLVEADILSEAPALHCYYDVEKGEDIYYFTNEKVTTLLVDDNEFAIMHNCQKLKSIIGASIEFVEGSYYDRPESGWGIFFPFPNLQVVNFPNVKSMSGAAFYSCEKLEEVYLGNLTVLSNDFFRGCISLKKVSVPFLKNIGFCTFAGCRSLEVINFSEVDSIGHDAFEGCTSLKEVTLPKLKKVLGWTENDYTMSTFNYCPSLQTLVIPSVVEIESGAFEGCKSLKTVEMPSVEIIGERAFEECGSLNNVDLPNVRRIGTAAFALCKSLDNIKLSQNMKSLGRACFVGCNFSNFDWPESLDTIPVNTFGDCESLKNVNVQHVRRVETGAFANCVSLNNMDVSSARNIGKSAFEGCSSLSEIKLSKKIEHIGESCFAFCNFENFEWPETVDSIQAGTFVGCSSLKKVKLPKCVNYIGSGAFEYTDLQTMVWPTTIDSIRAYTLAGCKSLKKLYLPKNLKFIDNTAFEDSNIGILVNNSKFRLLTMPEIEYYSSVNAESNSSAKTLYVPGGTKYIFVANGVTDVREMYSYHYEHIGGKIIATIAPLYDNVKIDSVAINRHKATFVDGKWSASIGETSRSSLDDEPEIEVYYQVDNYPMSSIYSKELNHTISTGIHEVYNGTDGVITFDLESRKVYIHGKSTKVAWQVINPQGVVCKHGNASTISMVSLHEGIYVVKVIEAGRVLTKKIYLK